MAELPEFKPTPRRSGWRNLLGCLIWPTLFVLVVGGIIGGVWWWHPWGYESKPAALEPGDCPNGNRTTTHLYILGFEVGETGSALFCIDESDTAPANEDEPSTELKLPAESTP